MKEMIKRTIRKVFNITPSIKGEYYCPVCGTANVAMHPLHISYFENLHKYQHVYNLFYAETLNFTHYNCAKCGASDRDRLYALYLEKYFGQKEKVNFLDIAPAASLRKFIQSHKNVSYRSMDLYMEDVDDRVDITNMTIYKDGQFDFLICSHVLEHIPDDKKAMVELFRILKPGGKAIVMVPINLSVENTHEDPGQTDIGYRWKYFGQDDHVRMYAKHDFIDRLKNVGFKVEQLDENYFGKENFDRCAIHPVTVLYIANK